MLGSKALPQTTRTRSLHRGRFYARPLLAQQTKERLYREGWGSPGSSLGSAGTPPGWERPVSIIVYITLHLHRVDGDSTQVLWPICKVTIVHFWTHCPSPFQPEQREQGEVKGALLHACGLPAWKCCSWVGQCPGHFRYPLCSYWPSKTRGHTPPAQSPLLHKAAFPRLKETAILSNLYK